MDRFRHTVIMLLALAAPAGAEALRSADAVPCFTAGAAAYRVSGNAEPADYTVRVDHAAGVLADLRMQFVDDPTDADFVLVDDAPGGDANACPAAADIKSIRITDDETRPDVTVSVDDGRTPDYRVYVHSAQYSHAEAAALLAVMWKDDGRRRHLASRD
jgi:hypothetical protein